MNATLAPVLPVAGNVGFFCQSGALGIAILDEAARSRIGLSAFVSAGNRADVSGNDLLQYWDSDQSTEVVLLYLESFGNPRKFSRIARRVARKKPIVAVKSGRHAVPPVLAATGVEIDDSIVRALFEQAGVIQVGSISQLFDCALLFGYQPLPAGPRLAVIGNSTALGVLAADAARSEGLQVSDPVDLGAQASPELSPLPCATLWRRSTSMPSLPSSFLRRHSGRAVRESTQGRRRRLGQADSHHVPRS